MMGFRRIASGFYWRPLLVSSKTADGARGPSATERSASRSRQGCCRREAVRSSLIPHAAADGRAFNAACQRLRLARSGGIARRAGRAKSSATSPVMSATVKRSPAMNGRSRRISSKIIMLRSARGRLAAAQSATWGSSSFAICGWVWRKTWAIGSRRCHSTRRCHISTVAR